MQTETRSLFRRSDTLFGVCQAIGEDFGFSPLWLRALFAVTLLWNPVVTLAAYAGLGITVLLSRWLLPVRHSIAKAAERAAAEETVEPTAIAA